MEVIDGGIILLNRRQTLVALHLPDLPVDPNRVGVFLRERPAITWCFLLICGFWIGFLSLWSLSEQTGFSCFITLWPQSSKKQHLYCTTTLANWRTGFIWTEFLCRLDWFSQCITVFCLMLHWFSVLKFIRK